MNDRAAFRITPDLRFLYPQPAHEAAFAALNGALRRGAGLALVDGEVGTGKTILLRRLEATLRSSGLRPRYIPYSELSVAALLDWADGDPAFRQPGRPIPSSILLLDDAENCSNVLLSGLQDLAAKRRERPHGPQIVLVGGASLWPRMLRELPNLAELVDTHVTMSPLSVDEIGQYVGHRLQVAGRPADLFSREAIETIAGYSRGVPRLVNQVCSRALILADLEQAKSISQETVAEAIEDCPAALLDGRSPPAHAAPAKMPPAPDAQTATAASRPDTAAGLPPEPPGNNQPACENEPASPPPLADSPRAEPTAPISAKFQPPAADPDGADATQKMPSAAAQRPFASHRRKEGRLKFKAVDAEDDTSGSPAKPEPPGSPPVFSGFVPRQRSLPVEPAPVDLPAPGVATSFSGFVPRRKEPDKPAARQGAGQADSAGRRRSRSRAVGMALAAVVIGGSAFYALRVSPDSAEAAVEAAHAIFGAAVETVRNFQVKVGELLRR